MAHEVLILVDMVEREEVDHIDVDVDQKIQHQQNAEIQQIKVVAIDLPQLFVINLINDGSAEQHVVGSIE